MVVASARWLLVDVKLPDSRQPPNLSVLHAAIRDSVHENFGDFGAGLVLSSLQTRHYSPHAEVCCVRVARAHAPMVRAAVTLVRFVQRQPLSLRVTRVCGSARTFRRAMLRRLKDSAAGLERTPAHAHSLAMIEKLQHEIEELQHQE
ncbi:hypothetical protein AB1Y20_012254 [Prymnesium parvum]|uniref:Uncharacterized protein n=1 Tax=Prymnesium parvum TaxID=97485 RepID=A0AB34IQV9_PRYPA